MLGNGVVHEVMTPKSLMRIRAPVPEADEDGLVTDHGAVGHPQTRPMAKRRCQRRGWRRRPPYPPKYRYGSIDRDGSARRPYRVKSMGAKCRWIPVSTIVRSAVVSPFTSA